MYNTKPIAVFDSGLGGISVLKELVRLMPNENFLFFGDSANAPYGSKSLSEVRTLTFNGVEKLAKYDVKAIVIACNTATSAAIDDLRKIYSEIPIIGLEPAIKPAALQHSGKRILVMATEFTIKQERCKKLMERYKNDAVLIPVAAPGLVEFVEKGKLHTPELNEFLHNLLDKYLAEPIEAIVLGCTHYPFVKDDIKTVVGDSVAFYDGSVGTARVTFNRISALGICNNPDNNGSVTIINSNPSDEVRKRAERMLKL